MSNIIDLLKGEIRGRCGDVVGYVEKNSDHHATVKDVYGHEVKQIDVHGNNVHISTPYGIVTERGVYDEKTKEVSIYDNVTGLNVVNMKLEDWRGVGSYDSTSGREVDTFGLTSSYGGGRSFGEEKVQSSGSSSGYTSYSSEYYMEEDRCIDETSSWIYDDDEDDEFDYIY